MANPAALQELGTYLTNQIDEAERSARAYRVQAAQCAELRTGLQDSIEELRSAGGDHDLELFLLHQIHDAAKAELTNLKEAAGYDDTAARHRAARTRLQAKL